MALPVLLREVANQAANIRLPLETLAANIRQHDRQSMKIYQNQVNIMANMINHIRSTMGFATFPPLTSTFPAYPRPATLTLLHVILLLLIGVLRLVGPDT